MEFRWIVSQIGARQHYGVPRGFQYKGELRLLYTEAWCRFGHEFLKRGNQQMRAFAGRRHEEIPNSMVVSFNRHTIFEQIKNRNVRFDLESHYLEYLRVGNWFAKAVTRDLRRKRKSLDPRKDIFFGFNTGCHETLLFMKELGIPSICDQMDPGIVEEDLVREEREKWPGWQKEPGKIPAEYWEHMKKEWAAAGMVLVNSNWSKQALIKQGVPAEKMFVVPVAYEAQKTHLPARNNMDRPITILWIGTVNLRKGIQYLIDAARRVESNPNIRFVIAGPIEISDQAITGAPKNMEFTGRITRDKIEGVYRGADVFVLPTVSDGFAITQVEAMAQGLPVVTTPNCGEVVTEGIDGYVVPACDGKALAEAFEKLESDRPKLREMSYRAIDKSSHFYLPRQAQLVEEAVDNYRNGRRWDTSKYKI